MNELLGNFWFLLFASITIITVAGAIAYAWQKIGRAEAGLKQAMLERGLSVHEMERLLRPTGPTPQLPLSDEQLVEKLANSLSGRGAEAGTIKQVMGAFNASAPAGRRLLCHAIIGLCDCPLDLSEEQILAVVLGLGRPEGEGVGISQDTEPKLGLPAAGSSAEWDAHGIRAEPS